MSCAAPDLIYSKQMWVSQNNTTHHIIFSIGAFCKQCLDDIRFPFWLGPNGTTMPFVMYVKTSCFFLRSFLFQLSFWCGKRQFAMSLTSPPTLNVSFSPHFFHRTLLFFCSFHLTSTVIVCHSNCFRSVYVYVPNVLIVFHFSTTMFMHGRMNAIVISSGEEKKKKHAKLKQKKNGRYKCSHYVLTSIVWGVFVAFCHTSHKIHLISLQWTLDFLCRSAIYTVHRL